MNGKTCEPDSKSVCGDTVWVRVPPPAPKVSGPIMGGGFGPLRRFRSAILAAAIAMATPAVATDPPDIPLRKCTFPYSLAPGAMLNRYCAGPPPVMSLRSGNDRVLVSVSRHTSRPIGVVIVLHNPTKQTRSGAAVVEFY